MGASQFRIPGSAFRISPSTVEFAKPMKRQGLVLLSTVAAVAVLAACDGFKEAFSAHQDVVARAGAQELSVTRLAELLGNSKIPLRKDVAKAIAELWVNYQLLGKAAAHNDSMSDPKIVDSAMWSEIANAKARKWYDMVSKNWNAGQDSDFQSRYNQGEMLAARHILLVLPPQGLSTHARDSIRLRAEALAKQVTPANFAELAKKNSQDPGSAPSGGSLGVFPHGAMVPEFEKGLLALKPGEISPVVQTQFGYHIIYRSKYDEVKEQLAQAMAERGQAAAESTYLANLEKNNKVEMKEGLGPVVKAIAADVDAHLNDSKVIASTSKGDFTAGRLAMWIAAFPPRTRIKEQIAGAPDSVIPRFVSNVLRNDLVLRQADSAKIAIDSTELQTIRGQFTGTVTGSWFRLGVEPKVLADSGKTPAERERIAAAHVEDFMDQLLMKDGTFIDVPSQVSQVLHKKYDFKLNDAGLDRALEQATRVRATVDSTRNANRPASAVPLPSPNMGQPAAPAVRPAQKPATQPAQKPAAKPAQKPVQKPASTPTKP
jgi:hypothetical protein